MSHNFSNFENLNTLFTTIGNKLRRKLETVNLTQAQYDALTPAEKMNGKAYFITDADMGLTPNSNSGGNNNYSFDEQEDGTWVDGSKIYKKTIQIPPESEDYVEISLNISNLSRIIKYEGGFSGSQYTYVTMESASNEGVESGWRYINLYRDINGYFQTSSYESRAWCPIEIRYANGGTIVLSHLSSYFNTTTDDEIYIEEGYITIWYTKSE